MTNLIPRYCSEGLFFAICIISRDFSFTRPYSRVKQYFMLCNEIKLNITRKTTNLSQFDKMLYYRQSYYIRRRLSDVDGLAIGDGND